MTSATTLEAHRPAPVKGTLTVQPLLLGEVEVDHTFLAWASEPGRRQWIPTTAYLVLGAERPILIDASFRDAGQFTSASGVPARRAPEQELEAQLNRFGLEPGDIGYLIHTHLHHDHTGLDSRLPEATILIQRSELQYAAAPEFPVPFFDRIDVASLVGELWGRVELLDGEGQLFDGIRTVHTGGHTPGHQMVYVQTPQGLAIITGDAAYVADINVSQQVPSGYWVDLRETMNGLRRIAADSEGIVLPMHDWSVFERHPDGIATPRRHRLTASDGIVAAGPPKLD
jgi:glyoxylase-like metal-dependent hydrolase (beta-lactamase superfamily II)